MIRLTQRLNHIGIMCSPHRLPFSHDIVFCIRSRVLLESTPSIFVSLQIMIFVAHWLDWDDFAIEINCTIQFNTRVAWCFALVAYLHWRISCFRPSVLLFKLFFKSPCFLFTSFRYLSHCTYSGMLLIINFLQGISELCCVWKGII